MRSITRSPRTSNNGFDYPAFHQEGPSGYEDNNMLIALECWCVTHQRPKVEWHKISESLFDDMKEGLSNDGWRLHSGIGGQLYFWRWAE